MDWAGMQRNVDFQGFHSLGKPSGCQMSTSESCKFAGVILITLGDFNTNLAKTEETNLTDYSWSLLMFSFQFISVPAWKRTNPPKLPSSTCTARVVCLMTSRSGWSAPASWGSTASPLTSRTALWPLGHTSTSVKRAQIIHFKFTHISFLLQSLSPDVAFTVIGSKCCSTS